MVLPSAAWSLHAGFLAADLRSSCQGWSSRQSSWCCWRPDIPGFFLPVCAPARPRISGAIQHRGMPLPLAVVVVRRSPRSRDDMVQSAAASQSRQLSRDRERPDPGARVLLLAPLGHRGDVSGRVAGLRDESAAADQYVQADIDPLSPLGLLQRPARTRSTGLPLLAIASGCSARRLRVEKARPARPSAATASAQRSGRYRVGLRRDRRSPARAAIIPASAASVTPHSGVSVGERLHTSFSVWRPSMVGKEGRRRAVMGSGLIRTSWRQDRRDHGAGRTGGGMVALEAVEPAGAVALGSGDHPARQPAKVRFLAEAMTQTSEFFAGPCRSHQGVRGAGLVDARSQQWA